MKTISFKIKTNEALDKIISKDSRICSSITRYAFNRLKDGNLTNKEIYQDISEKFKNINSHLRNSSFRNACGISKLNKDKKVYFGKWKRFVGGLITKEEYKESKNIGIWSEGEANYKGNRFFKLDISNNKFVYKRACKEHYDLEIAEKLSNKRQHLLQVIQNLMEEKKIPVCFRLKKDKLYIIYDEKTVEKEKQFKDLFKNRLLGIDLNPNYFGISVIEFDKNDNYHVIYKEVIDLNELQKQSKDKIHFELYEIDHHILKLCKQFHCSKLVIEELSFKKNNKFWSKDLNRLCKNKFRFSIVRNHLSTLCSTYGVELVEVNAAYSSLQGNFIEGSDNCPDMVAASIEIARRGYKKFEKGWYQPKFISEQRIYEVLGNQWKEELKLAYMSWKGLFGIIKKSKLKYRFQLNPLNAVFRHLYNKKHIEILIF